MDVVGADANGISVALIAGRTLRGQCLARFLEMSGLDIMLVSPEHLRNGGLSPDKRIQVAIIDTGERTSSDPEVRTSFASLQEVLPNVPILVLSDREDWSAVTDALQRGARAYFPTTLQPDILIEALRFVYKGGTFIPLELLSNAPHEARPMPRAEARRTERHGLTPTEQRVLELLRRGQPNKVIARELEIEEATVKVHVRRIMKKLNAANRTQAALVAQDLTGAVA